MTEKYKQGQFILAFPDVSSPVSESPLTVARRRAGRFFSGLKDEMLQDMEATQAAHAIDPDHDVPPVKVDSHAEELGRKLRARIRGEA